MATSEQRELGYGAVAIFDSKSSDLLGRGSYGKVCKAKCGQLPCAAKLPHNIILDSQDPNIRKFVEQFEQECQFLKMIKHPNVVQFLGTYRDPLSRRLALLMELMDESLTRFLERFTGLIPYHTQLNISQDVALALAYLHSNDIIHRDLTSNNVLLIGEGSRAKVTDFGMSRLLNKNPRMTQLTECPGNFNYMPPEALTSPPRYSSKLDCFSHGVLTIQIVTRQFPNPGDATITVEYPSSPTGTIQVPISETKRRKNDIDLAAPDHPLLPLALHCLKDRDTERPSADELCGRLAALKHEPRYTHSVEQSREQILQQQIREKIDELDRAKIEHQQQLERARQEKERELTTFQQQLQEREDELERYREQYEKELNAKETMLEQVIADCQAKQTEIEQFHKENQQKQEHAKVTSTENKPQSGHSHIMAGPTDIVKLTWRQGTPTPENMASSRGAAVVHGNTVYFSQYFNVYSYTLSEDKWTTLPPCEYGCVSLAVVNDKLTTIGGFKDNSTNILLCLSRKRKWKQLLPQIPIERSLAASVTNPTHRVVAGGMSTNYKWKQLFPPMPTERSLAASVTTPTHLVVAGGVSANYDRTLSTVEVLDLNTLQWSSASSSPKALLYPRMTLCGGYLYLYGHKTFILSCSVEELLKSCKPPSTNSSDGGTVWTRLTDIPLPYGASLATLRGHVLAIGGSEGKYGDNPTEAIHCYDRSTNSWNVIGEMPTSRSHTIVAVLPSNELIVVGGMKSTSEYYSITEIGSTN